MSSLAGLRHGRRGDGDIISKITVRSYFTIKEYKNKENILRFRSKHLTFSVKHYKMIFNSMRGMIILAVIKAFKGLRFSKTAGDISALVCPPYDIISDEERKAFLATNEHNVIRLELPREGENPYNEAGSVLDKWMNDGVLKKEDAPSIYIYEELFTANGQNYSVKGLICRVKIEEFSANVVLPHEETLSKAKTDRFDLMSATNCNFSQIYSLYNDDGTCENIIDVISKGEPNISLTDDEGVTHRMWIVPENSEVTQLIAAFGDKKLYIADGHHRYETALNYRNHLRAQGVPIGAESDYVMMCLVAMENKGLVVFPTHRIVRDLKGFDENLVLEKCAQYFDIESFADEKSAQAALDTAYANDKKAFVLYTGKYTLLILKDISVMKDILQGCSDALRGLDVTVLHSLVLERIFGIDKENMAAQINLTYTKAADDAINAVDSGKANCAFLLNPTRVTEIRDVAATGEKMPQKSTYFYPKLITGLVMNSFK